MTLATPIDLPDVTPQERTQRFLATWRARADEGRGGFGERLFCFFQAFRDAKPAGPLRPKPRSIDAVSFGRMMEKIAPSCRRARERGDLLDVWDLAGFRADEVRHSALLAWAIDPRSAHGLGSALLRELWRRAVIYTDHVPIHGVAATTLLDISSARVVHKELVPLSHAARRVDLCIDGDDMVVIVEVKIYAAEAEGQLREYLEAARARASALQRDHAAVLFVSPRRPSLIDPNLAHLSWRDVSAAIRTVLAVRPADDLSSRLLGQFADRVSRFH